jgi:hypothetical protein
LEPTPADTGDPRVQLAADRTVFAAERTYAAWVRTGLAALASGVGTKKVLEGVIPEWLIIVAGSVLVAFSAFCFGAAIWRELRPARRRPRPTAPGCRRLSWSPSTASWSRVAGGACSASGSARPGATSAPPREARTAP